MEPLFLTPELHQKGWGDELWIINNDKYCGKILRFNKGSEFSMHYHILKEETWFVTNGKLKMIFFDLKTAERKEKLLQTGDVVHLKPCIPHKLIAEEDSSIFEISTTHNEEDSYRVERGSSQK